MRFLAQTLSLFITVTAFAQNPAAPAAATPAPAAPAPAAPAAPTPDAAAAPAAAAAPGGTLNVIIKPVKPFAYQENGEWVGFSVALWKRVAQDAGIKFQFSEAKTAKEAIDAVNQRKADVAVGALSVTAARAQIVDFSYPFYSSGLQILAQTKGDNSAFAAFSGLIKPDTLKVVSVLLIALLANSHILWWLERRRNADSFPEGYVPGLIESTWWSVCTLISGGCENKAPIGIAGRLSAVVWMLAGIGLTAYITATLSATLTVNTLSSDIKGLGDLRTGTVGTVAGSSAVAVLQKQQLAVKEFADVESACRALAAGDLRAVVYDAPILRYYLSTNPGSSLQLVGDLFEKQKYAFALQEGSPQRTPVTLALVKADEQGFLEELDKKWFGTTAP
jgi:polar amino acid transport system substrate-binding protein